MIGRFFLLIAGSALIITPAADALAAILAPLIGAELTPLRWTFVVLASGAWGWYFDRILVWVNNMLKGA